MIIKLFQLFLTGAEHRKNKQLEKDKHQKGLRQRSSRETMQKENHKSSISLLGKLLLNIKMKYFILKHILIILLL